MKPKNFPARKEARAAKAAGRTFDPTKREIRTKKFGGRIARQAAWARRAA